MGSEQEGLMEGLIELEVFQSFGVAEVMKHTAWGVYLESCLRGWTFLWLFPELSGNQNLSSYLNVPDGKG